MLTTRDEKTKQIIVYLVKNHDKPGITCLMKLAYLIDYVSFRDTKNKLSIFNYIRYTFGPFDSDVYNYVESLEREGTIIAKSEINGPYGESVYYQVSPEIKDIPFDKISTKELEIINNILEAVKGYGAQMLTAVTYKTPPMKKLQATQGGSEGLYQTLDLSAV